MYKNIIFDIDGTLWNSTDIVALGWQKAVEKTGYSKVKITGDILKKEFGLPMNIIADHVFPDITDQTKKDEILKLACEYEHVLLEENEKDISYEGIADTMKTLAERGYKLFICSNCQKGYIELVMGKLDIAEYVDDFLCFGDTGLTKGETMSILMEKNSLKKEESVYVGDILGDKLASDYAGIDFVWAKYGFGNATDFSGHKLVINEPIELLYLMNE